MTDKERREEYALENLIQTAYEFSDDQLLKELEETEATLSDSDFPGIEDRIYQKLKARLAEEAAVETITEESEGDSAEVEVPTVTDPAVATPAPEEQKVVRFGKKKAVVVGILAAAFVGMLGVTAIGEKNYFFRDREIEYGVTINNDRNLSYLGKLNEAYSKIKDELNISVLRLGYVPEDLNLVSLDLTENTADLLFEHKEKYIHIFYERLNQEASVGINSDRNGTVDKIYNKWISDYFLLEEELIENGRLGYAAILNQENARYRILGQIDKDILIKIVENLTF